MGVTDYNLRNLRFRIQRSRFHLQFSRGLFPLTYRLGLLRQLRNDKGNLILRASTTMHIYSAAFNLNSLSDEQCLEDFRDRRQEIHQVLPIIGWEGPRTSRNEYKCDSITAVCIFTGRLVSPCRWVYLEPFFGVHASALSKRFWEVALCLLSTRKHLVQTFLSQLLQDRAAQYSESLRLRGSSLPN